ncbi:sensor histidine kinase [Saccharicrinis fermentans]|uniref:histidine kinase n=1 Tax=Saccharicrinis fermentans DSM 9555 = JCM 21142 TaxID=869213 RepID=W7XW05_9BACT|nr:PAS domain-containing sensor histidine kinase [Saccharicrinis fermentans]GAF02445.1 sensor protein ZraS [Saccharicrinis fermentans DSM 9555 = JCM 21142]
MKNYFGWQLVFRILIILALTVVAVICFVNQGLYTVLGILSFLVLIYSIVSFVKYLNRVHEHINFFFDAVLNEDFNSVYSFHSKSKVFTQLNYKLAKLNHKIQDALMANAQQEQYFRALIEHIGTGILTCNSDGFVIDANSGMRQLLGLDQLTHTKQLKKVDEGLMCAVCNIRHKEQKVVRFKGGVHQSAVKILLKAVAFQTGKERLMLISAQDINKELDENELDSWTKLIRVLTHEIMNSIAPITSLSESIASFYTKNGMPVAREQVTDKTIETTIRGLDVIQEQGKGLISFVESYRSLMRLPKPKKENIDLYSFLENHMIIHQKEGVTMCLHCADEDRGLVLSADKDQISQVLANLIKNAFYALKKQDHPLLELKCRLNDKKQVEIEVKDNGPGIHADIQDEIFIPFFTTKDEGSGIGLSISRQIMRLHGGWLKVYSTVGLGARFVMLFPKEDVC